MALLIVEILLQEYRTHRWARFTAWVLAFGPVLWTVDRLTRFSGAFHDLLWFVFWASALVSGAYYLGRLFWFLRRRLLWRLLPRLVVAYILIGVVPICLILALVFWGAFIINGQFAAYQVVERLREQFEEIRQINRVVLHEARFSGEASPSVMLDNIRSFYLTELSGYSQNYPGLVVTLQLGDLTRSFMLDGSPAEDPSPVPSWVKDEYANIVADRGDLALRSVERMPTPAGDLTLVLSEPFTPQLLDLAGQGIGPVGVVYYKEVVHQAETDAGVRTRRRGYTPDNPVHSQSLSIPPRRNLLDFQVFGASSTNPIIWGGDQPETTRSSAFVYVSSRIFALNSQVIGTLGNYSKYYVFAFEAVAVVFLLIEFAALIISVRMTRTMTRTVDTLYDATERVKAGDFTYRTRFPPEDQLTALGQAFDGMTASVQRLLQESQERLRLQSELDIAHEVQRQLFPQAAPRVPGLELYGVCKAARSVSGDYYDFFELDEHRVGLVLGDVSGKGISAALLMAAIQSALRAQFYRDSGQAPGSDSAQISPAQVVERLNRQIHANTPLEKYVTFFFAVYDSRTRNLCYTNAGHLPPLILRDGKIEKLEIGGTVVGLFPVAVYKVGEVRMEPHDLLLAYTDGITEPENSFGEEFGEARLVELMRGLQGASSEQVVEAIYRTVGEWTGSPELQDDMTLLLARTT